MHKKSIYFLLAGILFLIISCKPINIFSPLVNPSKMGNDAKLEAGYNAIADGNYEEAIEYFTDVIANASGDDLTQAYLGRGAAYMHKASPSIGNVIEDLLNGDIQADKPGAIIDQVVENDDYTSFFIYVDDAADDYNEAVSNTTGDIDSGVLFEAYEANMMAATGIGSQKIATDYTNAPWRVPTDVTLNQAIDAIINDVGTHDGRMETWGDAASPNGLADYVNGQPEETNMISYLTEAFNTLKLMKDNPPVGMDEQDVIDMQNEINDWIQNGFGEAPLS